MPPSRFLLIKLAVMLALTNLCMAQVVKVIYSFDGTVGSGPDNVTLAQGQDGQLYGTSTRGGTYGMGAIFRITSSGRITSLHSFDGTDGSFANGGVTLGTDGNFYGTTQMGGSTGVGVLFTITAAGVFTSCTTLRKMARMVGGPFRARRLHPTGTFTARRFMVEAITMERSTS